MDKEKKEKIEELISKREALKEKARIEIEKLDTKKDK